MMLPLFVEGLIWQLAAFGVGLTAAWGMFGRRTRNYR